MKGVVLFLVLVVGFFVAPALVAFGRVRHVRPRRGSLLAPLADVATARVVLVAVVVVVEGLVAVDRFFEGFAVAVGDAPEIQRDTVALKVGLGVTSVACVLALALVAWGMRSAMRVSRSVRRVREEGERADAPRGTTPSIDFGIGDAFWVFRKPQAVGYRETADNPEWARGTPPPAWAPFVGPVLDLLYGLAFVLLCRLDWALAT